MYLSYVAFLIVNLLHLSFQIDYSDGEEGKLEVRADDTKVVLPNLVSNNRYQVSVAAVSDGLVGPPRTSTFIFSDVASHSGR